MRLDQRLLQLELTPSRVKAQELIQKGHVKLKRCGIESIVKKPSYKTQEEDEISITDSSLIKYVARSGLKLEGAIEFLETQFMFSTKGKAALDMGASTGGFTECLLKKGAREVVSVDVGVGQIHERIKKDKRVSIYEGLNGREMWEHQWFIDNAREYFDLVVMDVSFISMTKLLSDLRLCLKTNGEILSLVKPQFELRPELLDNKGNVKDKVAYQALEKKICSQLKERGFLVRDFFESSLKGRDGNQEFFVYAVKSSY